MTATDSTAAPLDAVRALVPAIRAAADQTEQDRRPPLQLVHDMARAGLFRLFVPAALGGAEADVATALRVIEEASRADGSTGWCLMIGMTTGVMGGYLPEHAARAVFGDPLAITGGAVAVKGTATPVEGGYEVSGRWPFGSGVEHTTWMCGNCVVMDGSGPRTLPNGAPETRLLFFPTASAQIIDTWSVSGLRGTGSHDFAARDLFVPADFAVTMTGRAVMQPGPLYRFPLFALLAATVAAVALGIARTAIDELVGLAATKTPTFGTRLLRERPLVQIDTARAETALRSARAFLFETVAELWETASAGDEPSVCSGARSPGSRAPRRCWRPPARRG